MDDFAYSIRVGYGALAWLLAWLNVSQATGISSRLLPERTIHRLKSTIEEVVRDRKSSSGMGSRRRTLTQSH